MYKNMPEPTESELAAQIKIASEQGDYEEVKSLMQQLISLQDEVLPVTISDEELASRGVDMKILEKERELRDVIAQANQDGDFETAYTKMRELRQLQKLQTVYSGVKYNDQH